MEAFYPGMCLDQALNNLRFYVIVGCLPLLIADRDVGEHDMTGEFPERGIPVLPYPINDPGDRAPGILKAGLPAREPPINLHCLPHSANSFGRKDG